MNKENVNLLRKTLSVTYAFFLGTLLVVSQANAATFTLPEGATLTRNALQLFDLNDTTGSAFSSLSMPPNIDLSDFDYTTFTYRVEYNRLNGTSGLAAVHGYGPYGINGLTSFDQSNNETTWTFNLAGTVTNVSDPDGVFNYPFAVGDAYAGTLAVPNNLAPNILGSTQVGYWYSPIPAGVTASMNIGGYSLPYYTDDAAFVLLKGDNYLGHDYFHGEIAVYSLPNVPIPSTILMLGSGLVGLAGFRRKLRKR